MLTFGHETALGSYKRKYWETSVVSAVWRGCRVLISLSFTEEVIRKLLCPAPSYKKCFFFTLLIFVLMGRLLLREEAYEGLVGREESQHCTQVPGWTLPE